MVMKSTNAYVCVYVYIHTHTHTLLYASYIPSTTYTRFGHDYGHPQGGALQRIYSGVCYNEQFLSIKSGFYNEREGILSADIARACA